MVKPVLRDHCHKRPRQTTHFWQNFNTTEPVTRLETTCLERPKGWSKGWSFKTGSTVATKTDGLILVTSVKIGH